MPTGAELLRQAAQLIQSGEKRQAARILAILLQQEPGNEQAWWWLAGCVAPPEQKLDCLQRVLRINPYHAGARRGLLKLQAHLPLSGPIAGDRAEGIPDPALAATAPFDLPEEIVAPERNPEVEELLARAAQAEALEDFQAAYDLYARAVALDSSHALAWLGKGYAAGRLSSPTHNGVPEFYDCLARAVLARDQLGLALTEALTRLPPELAQALLERLVRLSTATARLAGSCPPAMANVFAIERVRLADCAYASRLSLNPPPDEPAARAELAGIALDAFGQVMAGLRQTAHSVRARAELTRTFRGLLLNHLTASGLHQDRDFLSRLDELIEGAD